MNKIKSINWKVRFLNKTWVVTFIAALFVLIGAVGKLFGFELDTTNLQENIVQVVYAVFGVLAVLGVVIDGTTEGIYDGPLGSQYTIPGGFAPEEEEKEVDE